ncbi:probable LRR receptor-like serine/threonine-protein kinase At3g47570 [Miscanthus floridulus]|uniref:probable LRR receptor-like serine/threonine-protein kinase At3g47570 n=1 Tax=Miscanthus floridulus TaxID=154761 RepID=UPI00345ABDDF
MALIQGNVFRGDIPAYIGRRFPSIRYLNLAANHFTGDIPASLSNLTTLIFLDLTDNSLTGYVPPTLGKLQALEYANLATNSLEADDSKGWEFVTSLSSCSQLLQLSMYSNRLTGQLPDSIGNLSATMQFLRFDQNGISGSIPAAISNLANLNVFSVVDTFISGVIPESIGKLANLVKLGLFNTDLSGRIPPSIGNLSKLTILDAYHANLEGSIPATIGTMKNLISLDLSYNRLNGSIPIDIFKLPVISIYINLSHNSLSGTLSSQVGIFANLNNLVLSGNQLSGEILDSIGDCAVLQGLWLDHNSFVGSIPQSLNKIKGLSTLNLSLNKLYGAIPDAIGGIHNLGELNLAYNNLSGTIPTSLQNLILLSELDLSFNNLQGEVPKEGIFRYLTKFSITGNNELCGGLPQLHLYPCQTSSIKKNRKWHLKHYIILALATTGALVFLTFIIAIVQFIKKKSRGNHSPILSPVIEEQYERVSYHALANGTNGFSEASLLGKGSFGEVYKCTFADDETTAAVKVFNLQQPGSTRTFVTECEALRRVHHRCLVKIITCCSSINHQGQEFKALIF